MPLVLDLEASRGATLVDGRSGREYLDFFGCFGSSPIGWNHPALRDPSPPSLTHSESEDFDFERRIPSSVNPYVCNNRIFGNSSRNRFNVCSGITSVP